MYDPSKCRYSSSYYLNSKGHQVIKDFNHKGYAVKIWERIKYGDDLKKERTFQKETDRTYSYEYSFQGKTIIAGSREFPTLEKAIEAAKKSIEIGGSYV